MLGVSHNPNKREGRKDDGTQRGTEKLTNIVDLSFDNVLRRAALMGLNISSDEFWEMRPDHFILMGEAYEKREQLKWLPYRRLMSVIVSVNGGTVNEDEFIWLDMIDQPKTKESLYVPTKEEIENIRKIAIKAQENGSIKT